MVHKGLILIARLCPTCWSPWLNLQPPIQTAFTLSMQGFPGTQSAKTAHGKWFHHKLRQITENLKNQVCSGCPVTYSYKSISDKTKGTGGDRDEGPKPRRSWNTDNTQPCLKFNLMFSCLSQENRISHKANSSHKINAHHHSETGTLVSKKKIQTLVS